MPGRREALAALGLAASALVADAAATAHGRIGLALASGGLHGFVHVGVIRALQQLHFRPHVIAGCSVGAIAGALWAAGLSADVIESVALDTAWRQIGMARLPRMGLSDMRRLQDIVENRTGGARIEMLDTRFGVVATDLATGRTVLLVVARLLRQSLPRQACQSSTSRSRSTVASWSTARSQLRCRSTRRASWVRTS